MITDVLRKLPHPPDIGTDYALTSDIFTVRHDLIRALEPAPQRVFEFGALYGFFLVTALDAAPSIYEAGWVDNETHTIGSNLRCLENVLAIAKDVRTTCASSFEGLADLTRGKAWDLVQVDGDHGYESCLADLRAAAQLRPRWIFVDDFTAFPAVWSATQRFVAESLATLGVRWGQTVYHTVNGLGVLERLAAE